MNDCRPDAVGVGAGVRGGTLIAGRYEIERELARGGMGLLWIASDLRLRRRVVVKVILRRPSEEMRDRFEREACAAAKLISRNVVQIYDFGVDQELAYMVMELLDGEDLGKRLGARSRLSLGEVRKIVEQAATALEQIHAARMLHRDLKPGNVFLARVDGEEIVKIIDFGIVRTADSGRWTHGRLGTPRYMSPEQFAGTHSIDSRSDLWSLAVIAYLALTGRHAFEGPTITALGASIARADFVPPKRLAPELPSLMDAFFKRALAVAPSERFSSAGEMATAFSRISRDASNATRILGTARAMVSALPDVHAAPALTPPVSDVTRVEREPPREAAPAARPPLPGRPTLQVEAVWLEPAEEDEAPKPKRAPATRPTRPPPRPSKAALPRVSGPSRRETLEVPAAGEAAPARSPPKHAESPGRRSGISGACFSKAAAQRAARPAAPLPVPASPPCEGKAKRTPQPWEAVPLPPPLPTVARQRGPMPPPLPRGEDETSQSRPPPPPPAAAARRPPVHERAAQAMKARARP